MKILKINNCTECPFSIYTNPPIINAVLNHILTCEKERKEICRRKYIPIEINKIPEWCPLEERGE